MGDLAALEQGLDWEDRKGPGRGLRKRPEMLNNSRDRPFSSRSLSAGRAARSMTAGKVWVKPSREGNGHGAAVIRA